MKHPTTRSRAIKTLIATLALGMLFVPVSALAQETATTTTTTVASGSTTSTTVTTVASGSTSSTTVTTVASGSTTTTTLPGDLPEFPAVTELPLLGSNITIELGTDENGFLASVSVDGEFVDVDVEIEDGEIEIEFIVSNANGTFEVEVKFEDGEIEIETEGFVEAGDYLWTGEACEGGALSVAYSVGEDGSLTLGAISGDVVDIDADGDEIEIRFADGSRVEFETDDGNELSIEFTCHDDDDDSDDSDDDSDDDDNSDDDDDSDDDEFDDDDDEEDDE